MRGLSLAILMMALPIVAHASTIVVIQGNDSPFGRRYFSGFSSVATDRISAFQYDSKKDKSLLTQIQKLAPDLVFTIGEVPLKSLSDRLPSTPFIVSDYYATSVTQRANIVLMENDLPIGAGLLLVQPLFPTKKTVGTMYNPKFSQDAFDILVQRAGKAGLKVASLKVDSPQDVKAFIRAFSGKIDFFYWTKDSTTSDEGALSEIFAFGAQSSVPILTGNPDHLTRGALMAISVDPFKLGEQAWSVAKMILKEGKIPQMPVSPQPSELICSISLKAAQRFGIGSEALYAFLQRTLKEGYSIRIEP